MDLSTRSPRAMLALLVAAASLTLVPYDDARSAGDKIVGSGVTKTEARNVTGFHSIALGVDATVKIRQGDSEGLSISGDDNVIALVETVVENGALKIRWPSKRYLTVTYKTLDIVVSVKDVDGLAVQGSGRIRADQIKSGKLRAAIDGSGEIAIDKLDSDQFDVAINGSGRASVAGRADSIAVALSGSGQMAAAKLATVRARVVLEGSPQASVWVKDQLKAVIAGSGEIRYYGDPQLTQTIAGSGRIKRVGDAP